jgi:hypothetical protein
MSIENALTGKIMKYTELTSKDKKYKMLPADAKVWFKEIDINNNIKNYNEIKGPGRIIKQLLKYNNIEYRIEYPIGSTNHILSRATLIYLSEP